MAQLGKYQRGVPRRQTKGGGSATPEGCPTHTTGDAVGARAAPAARGPLAGALGCVVRMPVLLGVGQAPRAVLLGAGKPPSPGFLWRRMHGRGISPARRRSISCVDSKRPPHPRTSRLYYYKTRR